MIKSSIAVLAASAALTTLSACGARDEQTASTSAARGSVTQLSDGQCLGVYGSWVKANRLPFFPAARNEGVQLARFAAAHPACAKAASNPLFLAVAR